MEKKKIKRNKINAVRGTQDIFPVQYYQRQEAFRKLADVFESYGYQGIDLPLIEPLELHLRKSGEKIIKGMYSFKDYGDRDICLRPEITASVVRAFNAGLENEKRPVKLYYHGPVFRYDKPQEGRYRQFTQTGVEIIGTASLEYDAEMIKTAYDCMEALDIEDFTISISDVSILFKMLQVVGLKDEMKSLVIGYLEDLNKAKDKKKFIPEIKEGFSKQGISKEEIEDEESSYGKVIKLLLELSHLKGKPPEIFEKLEEVFALFIDDRSAYPDIEPLKRVCEILNDLEIDWNKVDVDFGFGRGLEYYTGTVFEIYCSNLGAANQVCGGGRYDELLTLLGGQGESKSLGFSFGFERLLLAVEKEKAKKNGKTKDKERLVKGFTDICVIPLSTAQVSYAIKLSSIFRRKGLKTETDFSGRNVSKATKSAHSKGVSYVVYVGSEEEEKKGFTIKDMHKGVQKFYLLKDIEKVINSVKK